MRWPWQSTPSSEQWVLSWWGQSLAYVQAKRLGESSFAILQMGVLSQGLSTRESLVEQAQQLGLKGAIASLMLRTDQYQFLQIDTPAVPPEELRSAARYQVRDMLQTHVDDVTLDVVRVGDGQHKAGGHSFVVAATNQVVKESMDLAAALDCQVVVIDIQEMAQRNLQSALALADGVPERASAALVLAPGQQALLTISANEELFYTRRFDMPEGFLTAHWGQTVAATSLDNSYAPVEEYVPSYAGADATYMQDFSDSGHNTQPANNSAQTAESERAQRLVVEVQRSLDVWDRSWSNLPLHSLRVQAGERSAELAAWLTLQLGQNVIPLEVGAMFAGLDAALPSDQAMCWPLLGILLRQDEQP